MEVNAAQNSSSVATENLAAAETADGQPCVAGRALDALIAERVMGWKRWIGGYKYWVDSEDVFQAVENADMNKGKVWWAPSTDIAAAMEVVEKIRTLGKRTTITNSTGKPHGAARWFVEIDDGNCANEVVADAETLPEAICRAALAAVEVDEPEAGRGELARSS